MELNCTCTPYMWINRGKILRNFIQFLRFVVCLDILFIGGKAGIYRIWSSLINEKSIHVIRYVILKINYNWNFSKNIPFAVATKTVNKKKFMVWKLLFELGLNNLFCLWGRYSFHFLIEDHLKLCPWGVTWVTLWRVRFS